MPRGGKREKAGRPRKSGRPSAFKPEFVEQAKKLCQLGATDVDLADFFGVTINTIANWRTRHPAFLGALKAGKNSADERVERSLYLKALGYTFDSEKIFLPRDSRTPVRVKTREHVPPDTTAIIFWLKNRMREHWRDVQKLEHTGADGKPIETKAEISDLELARRVHFILTKAARAKKE